MNHGNKMRMLLARLIAAVYRFQTVRLAGSRLFQPRLGEWYEKRVFGSVQILNLGRSLAQKLLFLQGERLVGERFLIRRLCNPNMTVVDVGANIGYYVLLFRQCIGSMGRIIAVEPSPENLPELRQTLERNKLHDVEIHEVALGESEGTVQLRSGINSGVTNENEGEYSCPVRRLDGLVLRKVDFIKIDVEGFEGQVLEGAEKLIDQHSPTLFIEMHPHLVPQFGFSCAQILSKLRDKYSKVEVYDEPQQKLLGKIGVQYFGKDPLRRIDNIDEYVRMHDESSAPHTYWAVCTLPNDSAATQLADSPSR